ncbi:hypothetical protein [Pleomorphochaeta sp. DL1XJH-081]|uniref:hypothetical protein n=1 Tax=Pleomorphochaeta sp. DL1XJH-081 TaxID=3409690 RepID=UPI003BB79990
MDDTLGLRIPSLINMNPGINQRKHSQQLEVLLPIMKPAMFAMVERGVLERKGGKRVCILRFELECRQVIELAGIYVFL